MNARHRSAVFLAFRRSGWACLALSRYAISGDTEPRRSMYPRTMCGKRSAAAWTAHQVGHLPESQVMSLDIVLAAARSRQALEDFLAEVYNPRSSSYRHFLTVPEFTERFGPTQADYDAVVKYAKSNGLDRYRRHPRRHGGAGQRPGFVGREGLPS